MSSVAKASPKGKTDPPRPAAPSAAPKPKPAKSGKPAKAPAKPLTPEEAEEARRTEQRRLQQLAWKRVAKFAARGDAVAKKKASNAPKELRKTVTATLKATERKADEAKLRAAGKSAAGPELFDPCWICGKKSTFCTA